MGSGCRYPSPPFFNLSFLGNDLNDSSILIDSAQFQFLPLRYVDCFFFVRVRTKFEQSGSFRASKYFGPLREPLEKWISEKVAEAGEQVCLRLDASLKTPFERKR